MQKLEISSGEKYGDLTVIREVESKSGKRKFLCKCACGSKSTVRLGHLRSGHSTTCGRCGIAFRGQRKTLKAWASEYGLNESTLRARLKRMSMKEALSSK